MVLGSLTLEATVCIIIIICTICCINLRLTLQSSSFKLGVVVLVSIAFLGRKSLSDVG